MEVYRAFDRLIKYCEELEHPKTWKTAVIARLNDLKQQSLCDLDRRHDEAVLKQRWQQIGEAAKGTNLFDRRRLDHEIWPTIMSLVGVVDTLYREEPPRYRARESKVDFDKWEPREFFTHLKGKGQPESMTKDEKICARLAVNYLLSEATAPRLNRD